jgi:hypothetical protein
MPESPALQPPALTPRITNLLAAILLAIMAILLVTSVRQQSQTFDESTHLFAGFEYWKHADFGRNPEHPPFVKLLASLPLLPLGLHEPPPFPFPYFKAQDNFNAMQGRISEALALAQTAAQQAPDAADVNFVLGQTLLASGRIPEGRQAMATALRLARANHPDYQPYLIRQLEHP